MKLDVIKLELNGVEMPAPMADGVDLSTEHIWSKNTGRNGRGTMIGTVNVDKRTVTIKWPPLTEDQVALIEANVSRPGRPWVRITMTMADATVMSFLSYTGPHKSTGWKPLGGVWRRSNMQVSVIER